MTHFTPFPSSSASFSSLESDTDFDFIDLPSIKEAEYEDYSSSSDQSTINPISNLSSSRKHNLLQSEEKQSPDAITHSAHKDTVNGLTLGFGDGDNNSSSNQDETGSMPDPVRSLSEQIQLDEKTGAPVAAEDIEDILTSLEKDAIGDDSRGEVPEDEKDANANVTVTVTEANKDEATGTALTPTKSNVGDNSGGNTTMVSIKEEDQNEETIEVYLDDTSEVADGAAHTPVAMEDIEDILASLEQEAIDDNSGGEIQEEEIIAEPSIEEDVNEKVTGADEDDAIMGTSLGPTTSNVGDNPGGNTTVVSIEEEDEKEETIQDLVDAGDIEDILASLEQDAIGDDSSDNESAEDILVAPNMDANEKVTRVAADDAIIGTAFTPTISNMGDNPRENTSVISMEENDENEHTLQDLFDAGDIGDILDSLENEDDAIIDTSLTPTRSNVSDNPEENTSVVSMEEDDENEETIQDLVDAVDMEDFLDSLENEDDAIIDTSLTPTRSNVSDNPEENTSVVSMEEDDENEETIQDLVDAVDMEDFLDSLENEDDAIIDAILTPTTSNVSDNPRENTSVVSMEEEDQNEETIEGYLDQTSDGEHSAAGDEAQALADEEDIEDILASLEQEAIDDDSRGGAPAEVFLLALGTIEEDAIANVTAVDEDDATIDTSLTPTASNVGNNQGGNFTVVSIEEEEDQNKEKMEAALAAIADEVPSMANDAEDIVVENDYDMLGAAQAPVAETDIEEFLACLEEDSLEEVIKAVNKETSEEKLDILDEDLVPDGETPAEDSIDADEDAYDSPEDDTPREILIIGASTEECLDDYSSDFRAPGSYADDSLEGIISEYETMLGEMADAVLPVATEEDILFIKSSESEDAKEAPIASGVTKKDQNDASPRVASGPKERKKRRSTKFFGDQPKATTFASAKARASKDPRSGPITTSRRSPLRKTRTPSKIHESLYKESQAQQEEGRRRRKEIEERLSSNKELRTHRRFSRSPAKRTSRSPAKRTNESLYKETQAQQGEGRRRRKENENIILTKKNTRHTRSARSPSKIHESLYNRRSIAQQEEGRRRRKENEDKISTRRRRKENENIISARKNTHHTRSARSPSKIHESLYNRSIAQQEEGRKRRKQVEEKLSSKNSNRNSSRNHRRQKSKREEVEHRQPSKNRSRTRSRNDDKRENAEEEGRTRKQQEVEDMESSTNLLRHKRHANEGIFMEEISKSKKKISIYQAESLYERLMSHKIKTEERKLNLRRESEDREMQWLSDISQRKIPLDQANRIYYRGTVISRTRSRGRDD